MANYINLNELSITTQALLKKINEQAELKVDKDEVVSGTSTGSLIATIGDVDIYNGIDIQQLSDFIYSNLPVSDVTNSQGFSFVEYGTAKLPFEYINIVSTQTTGKLTLYTACANSNWGVIFAVGDSGTRTNSYENKVYKPDGTLVTVSTQSGSRKWYDRFGTEHANQNITFYTNRFYFFKLYNDTLIFYEPRYSLINDIPTKTSDLTNDSGFQTQSQVNSAIATAIGGINQFNVAVVQELPTTDIDTHTIYFVPNSSSGNNVYEEWMYINNQWELIGTTSIDLSGYVQRSEITSSYSAAGTAPVNGIAVASALSTITVPVTDVQTQDGVSIVSDGIATLPSIPSAVSDLTNDSGFITSSDIPRKIWDGICTDESNVIVKRVTCSGFTYAKGSIVYVTFSQGFSYTSGPYDWALNVNNTGTKNISNPSTDLNCTSNNILAFLCSGSGYTYVGKSHYEIPDSTSDLTNDSGFITSSDIPVTGVVNSDNMSLVSNGVATIATPFIVTVTGHLDGPSEAPAYYTKDKTFAQIKAAYDSGRDIRLIIDGDLQGKSDAVGTLKCDNIVHSGNDEYTAFFSNTYTEVFPTNSSKMSYLNYTALKIKSDESIVYNISSQSASGAQFINYPKTTIITNSLPRTYGTAGQIPVSQGTGTLKWITPPTVPTTTSELTNDSGYLTLSDLPIYDGTVV